jgi:hypothetical protein
MTDAAVILAENDTEHPARLAGIDHVAGLGAKGSNDARSQRDRRLESALNHGDAAPCGPCAEHANRPLVNGVARADAATSYRRSPRSHHR